MKMYRINSWGSSIDEIDVIRKTPAFIYVMRNGRERRESANMVFDTYDFAVDALVKRYSDTVESRTSSLEYAKNELSEVLKKFKKS